MCCCPIYMHITLIEYLVTVLYKRTCFVNYHIVSRLVYLLTLISIYLLIFYFVIMDSIVDFMRNIRVVLQKRQLMLEIRWYGQQTQHLKAMREIRTLRMMQRCDLEAKLKRKRSPLVEGLRESQLDQVVDVIMQDQIMSPTFVWACVVTDRFKYSVSRIISYY